MIIIESYLLETFEVIKMGFTGKNPPDFNILGNIFRTTPPAWFSYINVPICICDID